METTILRGYISRFLTSNTNGWGLAIFVNENNSKAQIKIKGSISLMKAKVLYEINGKYEEHPKYGKSFAVTTFKQAEANSKNQVIKFLSSPIFPGVGEKKAELIVNHFGDQAITQIKNDFDALYEVPGLDKAIARVIIDALKEMQYSERLISEFFEHNLKVDILNQVKKYTEDDDETEHIFKNNFLKFARDKNIFPFEEADRVAVHFGLDLNSPERIGHWAAKIVLDLCMQTGNTYTDKRNLDAKVVKDLKIYDSELVLAGYKYAKENQLLFFVDGKIYCAEAWSDEQLIAQKVCDIKNKIHKLPSKINLENIIDEIQREIGYEIGKTDFKYDSIQRQALIEFANSNFLILTGGPGTGKTTVIKGMAKLFTKIFNSNNIGIAAPTGRAAARVRESWSELSATTIHKMLEADISNNYLVNEKNPLKFDLLILDECSMIENHLFAQFIKAIGRCKKLVLVGDVNQLPSVGYGNVFEDLIDVNLFSTVKLTNIYRQAQGNGIIELAHAIQNNSLANLDLNNLNNVENFFDQDSEVSLHLLKKDFETNLDSINQNPFNYQIISPMYAGQLGVENLNSEIQVEFNSNIFDKDKVYDRGRHRYTIGDKIMFLKNDSEMDLTNGESGIIEEIILNKNTLDHALVNFGQDKRISLKTANFEDVSLSYACSVHKTQGSEYKHVVFAIEDNGKSFFLNKKLIYTAITRAKDKLVLIGDKNLFIKAAAREAIPRKTTLKERLKELQID
ncbi:exodeoxyribonuclease V subunit alpha [Williamsoniiplasma somnilux]|uniref:Exodeoxyribonuclease V subunit alpha n=1 Tax=Williamsoniiplasma somnilux TaxID=215578 RepID=A0A2K8NY29_9MOLU|nr:AAA family ATPase [Williamsoniiplasma somnilux]ATZ18729.1 exodeoxyribonuclease V subunit alpha [Williamsoniiplasma somnilux]